MDWQMRAASLAFNDNAAEFKSGCLAVPCARRGADGIRPDYRPLASMAAS